MESDFRRFEMPADFEVYVNLDPELVKKIDEVYRIVKRLEKELLEKREVK